MKKFANYLLIFAALALSCSPKESKKNEGGGEVMKRYEDVVPAPRAFDGNKQADITYQLLVYSFADSNNDGWGDINGIIQHLDYLDAMGASALWLSPIHPSDSYHGYDVQDYSAIHPKLGTEADFANLIAEAHKRKIKIYLDYVLNHSGTGNAWFKSASASKTSPYRSYYVFSDNPGSDISAGLIPSLSSYDSNKWYKSASGSYYYGAFWGGMPDLNYGPLSSVESNATFNALASSAEKWIKMGVDGLRLDAVLYLYEKDAPASNAAFLGKWYDRCNSYYRAAGHTDNIYMVGEAWTGTDVMAQYYKGLPALFDFEYWNRLSWGINNSTGRYLAKDIMDIRDACRAVRSDFIEATKLTNHDQTRVATVFEKSPEKEKLAACVLLTSPGKPYVYQGEELGYWGKIGSEGGADEQVRTPVKWTKSGKVPSSWTSASNIDNSMLTADISVEAQEADKASLLNVYKAFAQLRNSYPALAAGEISAHSKYNSSNSSDSSIACWYMTSGSQKVLVVHNFGSSVVTMDLSGDKLTEPIALNGSAKVKGGNLQIGAYSSVVFLQ